MTLIAILGLGLLHTYIFVLEFFLWTKPLGLKTFKNSLTKAQDSAVLAANQGLYNLFLAAGFFWSLIHADPKFQWQLMLFFSGCVLVAGIYGAYSVSKKIFFVQGLPGLIAIIILLLQRPV